MDKTIKTREVVKDIKTLQKKPSAPNALKGINSRVPPPFLFNRPASH
jgi:hypothetical protein